MAKNQDILVLIVVYFRQGLGHFRSKSTVTYISAPRLFVSEELQKGCLCILGGRYIFCVANVGMRRRGNILEETHAFCCRLIWLQPPTPHLTKRQPLLSFSLSSLCVAGGVGLSKECIGRGRRFLQSSYLAPTPPPPTHLTNRQSPPSLSVFLHSVQQMWLAYPSQPGGVRKSQIIR